MKYEAVLEVELPLFRTVKFNVLGEETVGIKPKILLALLELQPPHIRQLRSTPVSSRTVQKAPAVDVPPSPRSVSASRPPVAMSISSMDKPSSSTARKHARDKTDSEHPHCKNILSHLLFLLCISSPSYSRQPANKKARDDIGVAIPIMHPSGSGSSSMAGPSTVQASRPRSSPSPTSSTNEDNPPVHHVSPTALAKLAENPASIVVVDVIEGEGPDLQPGQRFTLKYWGSHQNGVMFSNVIENLVLTLHFDLTRW
ncbi:hypothetical protein M422DRAFT_245963 [Sphaerobolus stellatus SS14]|nr:hypothetical protein M422DRAFT_245963 [Sphaerobolus stellatus SS14]